MTLDALMDTLKQTFSRVGTGSLKAQAWTVIRVNGRNDLQRLLRQNDGDGGFEYHFYTIVDSNGTEVYNKRSLRAARTSWLDALTGTGVPDESLETTGTISRAEGQRAEVEVTSIRRTPSQLVIGRGSSASSSRSEGAPASVRGGEVDAEALAGLSGALRSMSGLRQASATTDDSDDEE